MTLTWNNSTPWATSANDETFNEDLKQKGLTDFGKQVVKRMNELGMLVDVSHVGEQTFKDVMKTTTKPVIASHSSVYQLCNHQRNLKDDQIKAIAENGGVIQVNFNPPFIDNGFAKKSDAFFERHKEETDSLLTIVKDEWIVEYQLFRKYPEEANEIRPPLSILIDHIDYIANLIGVDYVGLGSDFDGITITPLQLDDVTGFPFITKALLERGYSTNDIDKILGGNVLRVLKANESTN
jgi:membrane dipeptidase